MVFLKKFANLTMLAKNHMYIDTHTLRQLLMERR